MIAEASLGISVDGVELEALLGTVDSPRAAAVLCHPHPLHGGDMHNPVVVRAAEVLRAIGVATMRFNFRGVGRSGGTYGGGIGERRDTQAAIERLLATLGEIAPPMLLVGYSFGAIVAAHVAATSLAPAIRGLCLVAPPLAIGSLPLPPGLEELRASVAVAVGELDEYCSPPAIEVLRNRLPAASITVVPGANHFFFGKLFPLGEALRAWGRRVLGSEPDAR